MCVGRQEVRRVYLMRQLRYQAAVRESDPSFPFLLSRTPDDLMRFVSSFFALSKALDKAVVLAETVRDDPWIRQQASQRRWSQLRLWFGK